MKYLRFFIIYFLNCEDGNRKYAVSIFLGFLSSFAFAPLYLLPLIFISFSCFFLLLENSNNYKIAFLLGCSFGFGHFFVSLYWFAIPSLVGFTEPNILFFIATLILCPAVFSIIIGFVALLTFLFPTNTRFEKIILFAISWTFFEVLRSYFITPINLIGYIWGFSDSVIQISSVLGVFSLSLFTSLFALFPASILSFNKKTNDIEKYNYNYTMSVFILFFTILIGGMIRLDNSKLSFNDKYKIRVVNSNIEFSERENNVKAYGILYKYFYITHKKGYEEITNVIWPESSTPYSIYNINENVLKLIKRSAPKNGSVILAGPRYEFSPSGSIKQLTNSLYLVPDKGDFIFYDKQKLVPFGEYIPYVFRKLIPFFNFTGSTIDYSAGKLSKNITHKSFVPFTPLICYEAFYPFDVLPRGSKTEVFINIANDAWYGRSFALYQFLDMSKMRSIEYGIPTIRSSNRGISAVFDSYGRILKKSDLYKDEIIDIKLPNFIKGKTIYSKYTNILIYFILLFFIIVLLYRKKYCIISLEKFKFI